MQPTDLVLHVTKQSRLQILENYEDRWPFLNLRKSLSKIRININEFALKIIKHKLFEAICLCVIAANCYFLATNDPTQKYTTKEGEMTENIFLGLYSTEMLLKIVGLGFLLNQGAYLRDPWNCLDFVIVGSAWITVLQTLIGGSSGGSSIGALRAFRVLRPLRAVTSIQGLKVLVVAILKSIPLLQDTFIVLMFFFMIFAVAGLQLFSGLMKQVCVNMSTGKVNSIFVYEYWNLGWCGGTNYCQNEDFCGKQMKNADYGSTNYDNILYAFLNVFISVTMEGWSEFMTKYQRAYSWVVGPLFFIPLSYLGGYFLLNLLLAVINSSFGESTAQQQELARTKKAKKSQAIFSKIFGESEDWKNAADKEENPEIGVNEYHIAKRAASKIIANFRSQQQRQKILKIQQKENKIEEAEDEEEQTEQNIFEKPIQVQQVVPLLSQLNLEQLNQNKADNIFSDSLTEGDQNNQVADFLINIPQDEKSDSQRTQRDIKPKKQLQNFAQNDMRVSTQVNLRRPRQIATIQIANKKLLAEQQPKPISSDKKTNGLPDFYNKQNENKELSLLSFSSSPKSQQEATNQFNQNQDLRIKSNILVRRQQDQADSVILSEDSPKEKSNLETNLVIQNNYVGEASPQKSVVMAEIKRRFRKMKSLDLKNEKQNLQETINQTETGRKTSIKINDSKSKLDENKDKQQISFAKQADQVKLKSLSEFDHVDTRKHAFDLISQNEQSPLISLKTRYNPYDIIDRKTQKIEINGGMPYSSTSHNEIIELRNQRNQAQEIMKQNKFIQVNQPLDQTETQEVTYKDQFIKPSHSPYQLKSVYNWIEEDQILFDDEDEEGVQLKLQPYDTCTSVGFGHLLTHVPVKFRTRLSDIIVSSTLQITLAPHESGFKPKDLGLIEVDETIEWCNKRQEYRALSVKTNTLLRNTKDTLNQGVQLDKLLQRLKNQKSNSIQQDKSVNFSEQVLDKKEKFGALAGQTFIPLTLLHEPLPPEQVNMLNEDEKRLYIIQKNKHDSYKRQSKKMDIQPINQRFTLEDVRLMAQGKFHDEEKEEQDIEDEISLTVDRNKTNYLSRDEDIYDQTLENFDRIAEQTTLMIQKQKQRFSKKSNSKDYIPQQIQQELNLPGDLQENEINYNEILLKDSNKKRKTPVWSGQDVLTIGLNQDLAQWIVRQVNAVRVWPKGYFGLLKKIRVFLKMIVKHDYFGEIMLAAVIANTITMTFNGYGISQAMSNNLSNAYDVFNWIFIIEMAIKLLAVGVYKYLSDKMNWLDGSIVSLSIIEMILINLSGSGSDFSAIKTVRVLRTLRVLRIVRLLRSLESMQIIMSVLIRSASSFAYITMLLFVFLFIFTLLGMQLFGGNFDFPEGRCRQNYDTFIVGFYTAFQVMSGENWNGNIVSAMRDQSQSAFIAPVYHIIWIFIGNYVLLNLFLAILLDSFFQEDNLDKKELEEMQKVQYARRKALIEQEKIRRLQKLGASMIRTQNVPQEQKNEILTKKQKFDFHVEDVDDLDMPTVRQIFQEQGLIKKQKSEFEVYEMFEGISCPISIFIFTKSNSIRILALRLYSWKVFDNFIMFLIACSSIKLALGTYEKDLPDDSVWLVVSNDFDLFLNAAFLFECLLKIITLGFFMDEGSYLRDGWNQLDFFIVATSVMDMSLSSVNLPVLKILRLLRTLRPLRVISHNVSMKLIVSALFESVGAISNVVLVVSVVFLMFAIFGMNLFAGKFYQCWNGPLATDYFFLDMYSCQAQGYTWQPWPENFDDIGHGMLTLFCEASGEAWPDVMVQSLDLSYVDWGPVVEYHKENGMFFIFFMLVGNFFLMNFFVGVLFMKYEQAAKKEKIGFTEDNIAWIAIHKMILQAEVPFEDQHKPKKHQHLRLKVWNLVTSLRFEQFILLVIVLNVLQMAMTYETAPINFIKFLGYTNLFFTAIFIIEAILKIFTYGLSYFKLTWNKFDFFVVTVSLLDIFLSSMNNNSISALKTLPQIGRILRVIRVTRIIKVLGKIEGLEALLSTVTLAIGPVMNVFVLLILVLFIFSILGVFLFGGISPNFQGMAFYEYKNFSYFHNAFQTMFVVATGESWNYFMFDSWTWGPYCQEGYNCGSMFAPLYWITFVTVVQFVMINLFALVVIDQFEHYYMSKDSPLIKFKRNYEVFQKHWIEMTAKWRGVKMREKELIQFFKVLPPPIGFPHDTSEKNVKKIMLKMGIRSDDGFVYFNELLYRCMRRQYGNFKLNRKMQIAELITQFKLYQMTKTIQNKEKAAKDPDQFFNSMLGNGKAVNLFLQMMYFRVSFNIWRNYAAKTQKQQQHELMMAKKLKKMESMGRQFVPHVLVEETRKIQYVTIEQEQIIYLTSEEESSEEESDSKNSKATKSLQKNKNNPKQKELKGSSSRRRKSVTPTNTNNLNEIADPLDNSLQKLLPDGSDSVSAIQKRTQEKF